MAINANRTVSLGRYDGWLKSARQLLEDVKNSPHVRADVDKETNIKQHEDAIFAIQRLRDEYAAVLTDD